MPLFDNPFYFDDDCAAVLKTDVGWKLRRFKRGVLNASKAFRTPFQVDLDHLTSCGAFRRLQGKTQVRKVGPECFSRTRLSHSIEIARIAQSIMSKAHILENLPVGQFIDGDLVEFACFAHDIGNPPYGHAGERELNRQMRENGGFEGNAQSLRILTETAWEGTGISPTVAGVESILKYTKLWSKKRELPEARSKFLYDYQGELLKQTEINEERCIECQIMDLADDIGNALIDFSDGVRTKIITQDNVREWMKRPTTTPTYAADNVLKALRDNVMHKFATVRVRDCIETLKISKVKAIAKRSTYVVSLSPKYRDFIGSLQDMNKEFLFKDPEIQGSDNQGAFIIRTLFDIFRSHYVDKHSNRLRHKDIIPEDWHRRLQEADDPVKFRIICDYISGMTDDYAKMTFDRAIEVAL